jgi:hypothetical protein
VPDADAAYHLKSTAKQTHGRRRADRPGGVTFEWVIETVTGAEGQAVKEAQARAVGELARWLYERKKQKQQKS